MHCPSGSSGLAIPDGYVLPVLPVRAFSSRPELEIGRIVTVLALQPDLSRAFPTDISNRKILYWIGLQVISDPIRQDRKINTVRVRSEYIRVRPTIPVT